MKGACFFSPPLYWQRVTAAMIIGLLVGGAGGIFLTARRVERAEIEKERLLEELKKEQLQIKRLTQSLQERRTRVVTRLVLDLEVDEPFHETLFRSTITELLGDLVGMEVSQVDPRLVYKILDDRVIKLKEDLYRCSVRWVLISEKVEVGVEVTPSQDLRSE